MAFNRMLICNSCKSVDVLPPYDPDASPTEDYHLLDAIDKHLNSGRVDPDPDRHPAVIMMIDEDDLALIDPDRLKQAVLDDSLESFLKEERENYKEGAMNCYNLHNRPTGGCRDWCNDDRAIGRTVGVPREDRRYLCHFCPVATHVATEMRYRAGLYDS